MLKKKKKSHHNFIKVVIFVIYYKGVKKVRSWYLSHLTFTLSKFTLKNFIFLEMVSDTMVSPSIFHFEIRILKLESLVLTHDLLPVLTTE